MSRSGERWLVVVDLQRVFADPDSPWGMAGFGDVVPVVNALADRYAGRTVLTRFVPPSRPRGSWRDYYRTWDFALRAESAPMWELVPELVAAGAPVVDAPTMGKWTPALQAVVGEEPELVLCGVSTDCCVL
ncbi:MAG: isochorismatase family protein, partial [Nocardioidaceae bacterium]